MPTSKPTPRTQAWTSTRAYLFAAFCLVLGVALGYLFRGSASPTTTVSASAPVEDSSTPNQLQAPQITPEQQKAMVDEAVAPLLAGLKQNPDDFDAVVKVANLYYDGQQYSDAVKFYGSGNVVLVRRRCRQSDCRISDGAEVSTWQTFHSFQSGHCALAREERPQRGSPSLGRIAAQESQFSRQAEGPGIHRARQAARRPEMRPGLMSLCALSQTNISKVANMCLCPTTRGRSACRGALQIHGS